MWDLSPVISVLGAVSAASAVAGLSVAGYWLLHQRDSLGPAPRDTWKRVSARQPSVRPLVPQVDRTRSGNGG